MSETQKIIDVSPRATPQSQDSQGTTPASTRVLPDSISLPQEDGNKHDAQGNGRSKAFDAQRAQQILDRAFLLSERGDVSGAIAACRQSITLAPHNAASHSMLGFLLERSGDFAGAMKSYEKTLQLAPDSPLERDSLRRLQVQYGATAQANNPANAQDPHSGEVAPFNDTVAATPHQPTVVAAATSPAPPDVITSNVTAQKDVAPVNAAPVTVAVLPASQPVANRVLASAPAPVAPAPVAPAPVAPVVASPVLAPTIAPTANALLVNSRINWWAALDAYPTFWTRSLPLMSIAGTGLLWMLWAHNAAAPRVAAVNTSTSTVANETTLANSALAQDGTTNTAVETSNGVNATANGATPGTTPSVAPGTTPAAASGATPTPDPNGLFSSSWVITNKPQRATPAPMATTNSRSSDATRVREAPSRRSNPLVADERSVRRMPQRSFQSEPRNDASVAQPLPPAPPPSLPPASVGELPRVESRPVSPSAPRNTAPALSPDQLPPTGQDDGGNGGIRPYEGAVPEFPNPTTSAQPSLQPLVAQPSSLNSRNNSAAETAYRYQSRALIYLERGDNAKATSDFNSAIAFYQRQIATGVGVADARRGMDACRKGLTLVRPR